MSENKFSLINFGESKVPEKIYDDVLSEPSKKLGHALGTIINVGNSFLWPVKWANERTRIFFENNLKKYEEKISLIEEHKIIEVPTEISMPILERFTYVSNDEISNAFVNLLSKASNIDTINLAHPSFIQIIDRISPDEALIIKLFSEKDFIPYLTIGKYVIKDDKVNFNKYINLLVKANLITELIKISFNENIGLYIDNLISLGLIRDVTYYFTKSEDEFEKIEKLFEFKCKNAFDDLDEKHKDKSKRMEKGMYELTEFGKLFTKACLK
ncbi:MAG: DUF4393 domain-containing protein [Flavobacteriia bacterium]|jgi:hypothetical protein|uniref:DUF4393 domain-containing protein n=1 Tax=Flavobacterium sp. TaxID=239 RepID=UPI002977720A|nr:MAG: DUF4393 domain-containing protein [Flavobacteriia bacterium]